jgi:hypothetical protein
VVGGVVVLVTGEGVVDELLPTVTTVQVPPSLVMF